jgi:energy-coupling factor transporter ATP-binding protein EcfA2
LFLLDEPASNLHSSAQIKILEAIKELSLTSIVIYSTHSHHLINPKWLSGTFVVINDKISDETLRGEMTFNDSSRITAIKYFTYVGQGKGKTKFSYFQPILDALDYAPSSLEPIPNIVITEGKYDWYAFTYMNETILKRNRINFYPGGGRDSLWNIIELYLAWGAKFIAVLDGDTPGNKSKQNYCKEFAPFLDDRVFTLKEVLGVNGALEELFSDIDKKTIVQSEFPTTSIDGIKDDKQKIKELFNQSINLLCFKKKQVNISDETKDRFTKLFDFIETKFS